LLEVNTRTIGRIEHWYLAGNGEGFPKYPMFFHFRELRIEVNQCQEMIKRGTPALESGK
jgi:hypothetical protein